MHDTTTNYKGIGEERLEVHLTMVNSFVSNKSVSNGIPISIGLLNKLLWFT